LTGFRRSVFTSLLRSMSRVMYLAVPPPLYFRRIRVNPPETIVMRLASAFRDRAHAPACLARPSSQPAHRHPQARHAAFYQASAAFSDLASCQFAFAIFPDTRDQTSLFSIRSDCSKTAASILSSDLRSHTRRPAVLLRADVQYGVEHHRARSAARRRHGRLHLTSAPNSAKNRSSFVACAFDRCFERGMTDDLHSLADERLGLLATGLCMKRSSSTG